MPTLLDILLDPDSLIRNPREFVTDIGFYTGASSRLLDTLIVKDINTLTTDETVTITINQGVRS